MYSKIEVRMDDFATSGHFCWLSHKVASFLSPMCNIDAGI
jgi:hypothetical protein